MMTKPDQTNAPPRKYARWIAIGAFAEVAPLIAAVAELILAGASVADLCLSGMPESMRRVAAAPEVKSVNGLACHIRNASEVRLAGSDVAILAVSSCGGNPSADFSGEATERLRGFVTDGCVLLGVPAASGDDMAKFGRILLRHSSRHVNMLQYRPIRPQ